MNTNTDRIANQNSTWSLLSPDDINRRHRQAYRCRSSSRSESGSNQPSGQSSTIPSSAHTPLRSMFNSPRSSSTSLGIHDYDLGNLQYLDDLEELHEAVEVLVNQVQNGGDEVQETRSIAGTSYGQSSGQDEGDDTGNAEEGEEEGMGRAPTNSRNERAT